MEIGALSAVTARRIGELCKALASTNLPRNERAELTGILQGHLEMATTTLKQLQHDAAGRLSSRDSVVFDQVLGVLADMS
jgi:hypothetical protein